MRNSAWWEKTDSAGFPTQTLLPAVCVKEEFLFRKNCLFTMAGGSIEKLKDLNNRVNEGIRQKFRNAKQDPRAIALVVIELLLTTAIILSLIFLFDPQRSFPDAQKIPDLVKVLLIVIAMYLVYRIYAYTKDFRG